MPRGIPQGEWYTWYKDHPWFHGDLNRMYDLLTRNWTFQGQEFTMDGLKVGVMTREFEHDMFVAYNFCRYVMANRKICGARTIEVPVDPDQPCSKWKSQIVKWRRLDMTQLALRFRDELITRNLRLAFIFVNKIAATYTLKRETAKCTCWFAIVKSVDGFDVVRGNRFNTYACGAMIQELRRDKKLRRIDQVTIYNDIAEYTLDWDSGYDTVARDDEIAMVMRYYNKLEPRRRSIVAETILNGRTLKAVGAEEGVTKERVRQLRNEGLAAIRSLMQQENVNIECRS